MDDRFGPRGIGYGPGMESISWKAASLGIGALGAIATRKALAAVWPGTDRPPLNPADRRIDWPSALAWAVASGVGAGIARVVSKRGAAAAWESATGNPPPGVKTA